MSIDIPISGETKVNITPYGGQGCAPEPDPSWEPEDDTKFFNLLPEEPKEDYISRCHYGALVLNSFKVFIADVDVSSSSKHKQLRSKENYIDYFLRITRFLKNDFMLFETKKGFRVVMTSDTCNPTSTLSKAYMALFLADELYAHNCVHQQCYRARLTPKPQRLGMEDLDKDIYKTEQDWLDEYEEKILDYSVCNSLYTSDKMVTRNCPKVLDFLALHTKYTGCEDYNDKELA